MVTPRNVHTATLLPDGKVLVAGGVSAYDGKTYLASAEVYDPATGIWTATGKMIETRGYFTATRLTDGRVLVAGGHGRDGSGIVLTGAELFDPTRGSWTAAGAMITARYGHAATLLADSSVLVAGGEDGNGYLASAELYDPEKGTWTATASMFEARTGQTATLLRDGTVLLAGGVALRLDADQRLQPLVLPMAELYDPGSGH